MFKRGRLWRAKMKLGFRQILDSEQVVELVPGFKMQLDLKIANQDSIFWFFEETEPALQWAIKHLFPLGGRFLDVGANVGLLGLLAIYWRQAQVVFVEPHPRLAEAIRTNLTLNDFQAKGEVLELAASDSLGEAVLNFSGPHNDGDHSLQPRPNAVGSCKVNTNRLDTVLENLNIHFVDMIKIDAQGFDYEILLGLGDFLCPKSIALIFIEMEYLDGPSQQILELLLRKGYRPFAAGSAYIDELHYLDSLKHSGKIVSFFRPTDHLEGGNFLWCGRGSFFEEHLLNIHCLAVIKP